MEAIFSDGPKGGDDLWWQRFPASLYGAIMSESFNKEIHNPLAFGREETESYVLRVSEPMRRVPNRKVSWRGL
ncbi:unnamed protein product [Prunus armeniaca]|uniref:Uncharacterized protein n=1 Tax=Prunus armeniaca TaxID=36596 RepID=A0A6J5TFW1_PRUAR|nr:unnamed protein product [Prunus armeniaca]